MKSVLVPLAAVGACLVIFSPGVASADDPHANGAAGQPSQSCQSYAVDDLKTLPTPGNSANSPGSPFNEPGFGSPSGGNGGAHYSANSQYDVACFQHFQHSQMP